MLSFHEFSLLIERFTEQRKFQASLVGAKLDTPESKYLSDEEFRHRMQAMAKNRRDQ